MGTRGEMHEIFRFSERVQCLPVVNGSGDSAVEVRRCLLDHTFDCLALPLPESFRESVESGVTSLPNITIALQEETNPFSTEWNPDARDTEPRVFNYVPIDPCQPVIAAIRIALQEHLSRAYIDSEVGEFETEGAVLPDPYALKQVPLETFATAVLPSLGPPRSDQRSRRNRAMAQRLKELERVYSSILFVCSVCDWPWVRDAYREEGQFEIFDPDVDEVRLFRPVPEQLIFMLGELPFITGLYEQARFELDDDENLSVDGIKELLLTARERYRAELKGRGRRISPHLLRVYLKYVRNLCLLERRMTPDLYTLVTAAQQIAGDQFAISLVETAREYPFRDWLPYDELQLSIDSGQLPSGETVRLKNRLPGHPRSWRRCELKNKPPQIDKQAWAMRWNPFSQCSWPPEDVAIERFRTHVKDRALAMLGNDLARTEKFTTSLKDGLDIRETLRNWHTGDLYVKEIPPSRGTLDCVIMLFDSPADPREYPWRLTWHAEHQDESTLSFFATSFQEELVGPGIAMATYGGAMFLFPPRPVRDVWKDSRFDFADTLEERLLAAACHHSTERHIAILSASAPGAGWRRLAKRHSKRLLHIPLAHFSQETVQQLRMFHVLNGHQVRSYAEHFIRKA